MKVTVTGGTGFAGTHLIRRLVHDGHEVTSIDLGGGSSEDELRSLGVRLLKGSVTDRTAVDEAVGGADVVQHLASAFRDIHAPNELYWDVDVNGTRTVLEASRAAGVRRVVHCSTQGVHGILEKVPGDENSPIAPRDYYCYAKYHAERVCEEFIAEGMDVVIVRPTSIYGPGDTHGWLTLFRMIQKGRFLMVGDGRTWNHPVYVENLVQVLMRAAEVPEAKGRTYIAADDRAVTLNQLVAAVAETLDVRVRMLRFPFYRLAWGVAAVAEFAARPLKVEPMIFRRRLSWFRTNRSFSIARAQQELGYQPAVPLKEGLARTAAWYREQGLL
jgi:nucleoside-diphosphate-sugar epimerase